MDFLERPPESFYGMWCPPIDSCHQQPLDRPNAHECWPQTEAELPVQEYFQIGGPGEESQDFDWMGFFSKDLEDLDPELLDQIPLPGAELQQECPRPLEEAFAPETEPWKTLNLSPLALPMSVFEPFSPGSIPQADYHWQPSNDTSCSSERYYFPEELEYSVPSSYGNAGQTMDEGTSTFLSDSVGFASPLAPPNDVQIAPACAYEDPKPSPSTSPRSSPASRKARRGRRLSQPPLSSTESESVSIPSSPRSDTVMRTSPPPAKKTKWTFVQHHEEEWMGSSLRGLDKPSFDPENTEEMRQKLQNMTNTRTLLQQFMHKSRQGWNADEKNEQDEVAKQLPSPEAAPPKQPILQEALAIGSGFKFLRRSKNSSSPPSSPEKKSEQASLLGMDEGHKPNPKRKRK